MSSSRQWIMPRRKLFETLSVMALFYGTLAVVNAIILGKAELCIFRMICGLPCPGCGLTHSTIALLRGDFVQSLKYCPFTVLLLATIVGSLFSYFDIVPLPKAIGAVAHFLEYNRVWHAFLAFSFATLYIVRLLLYFPDGPYPMVYNPNNYLAIGWRLTSSFFHWLF